MKIAKNKKNKNGQAMIEYILIISAMALGGILFVKLTGDVVKLAYRKSANTLGAQDIIPGADTINNLKMVYIEAKLKTILIRSELNNMGIDISGRFKSSDLNGGSVDISEMDKKQREMESQRKLADEFERVKRDIERVNERSGRGLWGRIKSWWRN